MPVQRCRCPQSTPLDTRNLIGTLEVYGDVHEPQNGDFQTGRQPQRYTSVVPSLKTHRCRGRISLRPSLPVDARVEALLALFLTHFTGEARLFSWDFNAPQLEGDYQKMILDRSQN